MSAPVDIFTTQEQIDSYLNTLSQKYLGNDEFILSATSTGNASAGIVAIAPYGNLSNRYFPTVAVLPSIGANFKTYSELGGYFVPSKLGASIYLTKEITYSLDSTQIQNGNTYYFIQPTRFNKGRGLTLTDQDQVITHYVNTDWMKSTNTSFTFDGNIVGADTFQKFLPYQSAYETTKTDSNGVVNARYDFEFWTGNEKQTWVESNSATKLTTEKYFDLNTKINNLVLTEGQELYSWQTDIFGNQFALYKPIVSPRSLYRSLTATGSLWVKTIDNTISVGPSALEQIYRNYENNSTIYSQLTNNEIINFEVFFDTLVIQLENFVLYEKVTFNYNNYTIEKSLQNYSPLSANMITNSTALSANALDNLGNVSPTSYTYFGGNWYNNADKIITICTLLSTCIQGNAASIIDTGGLSSLIVPVLYEVDLNRPQERKRVYPNNNTEAVVFLNYVYPLTGNSGRGVSYMEAPVFCYNEDTNLYLTTFISFSGTHQQANLITYKIAT